ncbi:TPA: hypothetical protein N0F65_013064 [Lagenidium giganteum]|uniref:Kinetochore protein SPC25 n=1 Tax=Lagenidium giganteum TaxID=4803 RepID=A0AAV2YBM1_9STRA|nr:TPA: hypothetical protein N0F65_013064 [Lagenidium giganteum]
MATTLVENLYATSIERNVAGKTTNEHEFAAALQALHRLENEYMSKQAKQNLLDKLAHVADEDDLKDMMQAKADSKVLYMQRKALLDAAVKERMELTHRISQLARAVRADKEKLLEVERAGAAHSEDMARLTAEWKELQKRNAQRKAALQIASQGHVLTMNDEEDCHRVLEQQTASIQALHESRKKLEDTKMDLTTSTKQMAEMVAEVTQENTLRSGDLEAKQREEELLALGHMQKWYDDMRQVLQAVSSVEIVQVTSDFLELRVLDHHGVRCFFENDSLSLRHVEFLPSALDANDLVTADLRAFLSAYKQRLMATPTKAIESN